MRNALLRLKVMPPVRRWKMGIDRMADAITLQNVEIEKLGDDFCIVGYVK